jgi:cytochrome d ubiquinol oxidase subunit II
MIVDLPVIWAFLLAAAVFLYVVLDGFDLGLGILFPAFRDPGDRSVMVNTVAPVWDGNETWLVLGGGGLFAAFPLAYALILPALYMPVIAMLLALVFRGVAFEFRWRVTDRNRRIWDWGFTFGSVLAAFSQGAILGAILQGIEVDETARRFAGGAFDWLSPFSLLTGLSVVAGYALLGATWLVMKTEGALRARARRLAWPLAVIVVGAIGAVSLATPFLEAGYMDRWFAVPHVYYSAVVPVLVGLTVLGLFHSLRVQLHDYRPFLLTLVLYGLCFAGLGVSIWPNIVPPDVTIHEAAAPPKAQGFMLLGAGILLPVILAYTAYAFWVFRGKVTGDTGYH